MTAISFALAALIGYGFYAANQTEPYVWLIAIGSGVISFATLTPLLAVTYEKRGATGNIRALSAVFFIIFLIANLLFSFTTIRIAPYIVTNGIAALVYVGVAYAVGKK